MCARARGCVPWCVREKYKTHKLDQTGPQALLGRGEEGRLRIQSPVFYCREHLQYIKRRTSRRKDAQEARRGEGGKFFRATSRRAPLASLPPFPLLAPLALNPCFCSFLLASGVHKLVLSLALSTHSAVKKGGTMTKRIGERGGYCRFPKTFGSNEPRVS